MRRERSHFQVWYCEEGDDFWHKYAGRLWSEEAASKRVEGLMRLRPTRKYRITEYRAEITSTVIFTSEQGQPA